MDGAAEPAQDADEEHPGDHHPAAGKRAGKGVEVLEPLLEACGVVGASAQPVGEGPFLGMEGGDGHRPSPLAVRSVSTAYPARSSTSRPPSSRSTTANTPRIFAPSAERAAIASWAEPPVVITSSTTTTDCPASKQPSMRRPVPWVLACFRMVNASTMGAGGRFREAAAIAYATGSAPRVSPPTARGAHPRATSRSTPRDPMRASPSADIVVRRVSI